MAKLRFLSHLAFAATLAGPAPGWAQDVVPIAIEDGTSLSRALRQVALASGRNLIAPAELLAGRTAPAIHGRYAAEEAVRLLLAGSGLTVRLVDDALIVDRISDEPGEGGRSDIVVTGTRIRGAGPIGSSVLTISRTDIDRSGFATTQQLLQALPQNFGGGPNEATSGFSNRDNASLNQSYGSAINLRGLGSGSTLVLVNGNRPPLGGATANFVDLSLIPSSAIARIEILADGASAVYGSDAVAGVVNIVTRTDFDGFESRARVGSADGDRTDIQIAQLAGARWTGGRGSIAYEFVSSGRLRAADRAFASEDLRRFGGPDLRQPYASPGNLLAGGIFYPIPAGQDGRTAGRLALVPGAPNVEDQWRFADLLPQQRRHAALAHVEQSLGENVLASADGYFGYRRFSRRVFPDVNNAPRTVPSTNPFYVDPAGTGEPATLFYSFQRDLGPVASRGHARVFGGTAGLTWSPGSWQVEARASGGRSDERAVIVNLVNATRLAAALADSDPATAYNLFGDGPSTSEATIDRVRGSLASRTRSSVLSALIRADGPLLALPAGAVKLAAGGELRREHVVSPPDLDDSLLAAPRAISLEGLPGPRWIGAGFAELAIPLVGPDQQVPLARRIDLSAAVRVEHYSDFGTTTNPRFGLRWDAVPGLAFRAAYGTSFRAPGFNDLRRGPQTELIFAIPLADPQSATGTTNVLVLRGNKPGLQPEKARSWTAGVDVEPRFLPGLRVSLDWYDIRYRDRIASPAAELFSFLSAGDRFASITDRAPESQRVAQLYAAPSFRNFFNIPPAAIGAIVDARTQNLASIHQRGFDLNATYSTRLGGGTANISLLGSVIETLDQKLTPDASPVSLVGQLGNPVRSRFRASAGWTSARWSLAGFVNRVAGYRNTTQLPAEPVASWTTVDLSLSHELGPQQGLLRGLRIALSATNLFDRRPPYVQNNSGLFTIGYDPDLADPLGRVIALELVKSW